MRRSRTILAVLVLPLLTAPVYAMGSDDHQPNEQSITELQQKIQTAHPREQCYLYAELIHEMTEMSIQQYAAGNSNKGNALLQRVQELTHKLHKTVSDDDKRLKKAEILLRHTVFRLSEMLHDTGYQDRKVVAKTLQSVSQADNDAMLQVFKK